MANYSLRLYLSSEDKHCKEQLEITGETPGLGEELRLSNGRQGSYLVFRIERPIIVESSITKPRGSPTIGEQQIIMVHAAKSELETRAQTLQPPRESPPLKDSSNPQPPREMVDL
ncbi:MAG: hypothetical protein NT076_03025 [Candidatus Pacearchaeota archaeon]|nr:hypothetical protein [Candidatus Pacearchaeota archaeon]